MPDVEDQLRRYGAALERAAAERVDTVRDLPLVTPASPSRSMRWLAAAAALLLVVGVAAAASRHDDDRIRTADEGTPDDALDVPAAPAPALDCGPDGLISSGSLDIGTDPSGQVDGAEATPEAALRRFVDEWTLVRYPAVDGVHDGGDADPQPGYTLEPAGGSGGRSVTYRLPDLRIVGIFGLVQVNEGEGWVLTGVSTCFDWSGTLPTGPP